jgi:hypothetical protein
MPHIYLGEYRYIQKNKHKMKLKKFSEFISGVNEDSGYPMGSEFDPDAPWNKKDPETHRSSELSPSEIRFDLIAWDGSDHALLKDKNTEKMFALYIDTSDKEFREFVEIPREYIGKDEEGFADYEDSEFDPQYIDDVAIVSYATEQAKKNGIGKGIEGMEDGKVSEINEELASDILDTQRIHLKRLQSSPSAGLSFFRNEKIKPLEDFIEILSQNFNL